MSLSPDLRAANLRAGAEALSAALPPLLAEAAAQLAAYFAGRLTDFDLPDDWRHG